MKTPIILLAIILSFSTSCKSKKEGASTTATSKEAAAVGKTVGKVSHQYRATGCATVIIIPATGTVAEITLIPSVKLASEFDVDGMQVSFNYQTLRMPQPEGCTVGLPAEIKDIAKK